MGIKAVTKWDETEPDTFCMGMNESIKEAVESIRDHIAHTLSSSKTLSDFASNMRAMAEKYHGVTIRQDLTINVWSNIHYAVVGTIAGFSYFELEWGAAVANLATHGMKALSEYGRMDDPADQEAIRLGFELLERHGPSFTVEDLISLVRERAEKLNTFRCSLEG